MSHRGNKVYFSQPSSSLQIITTPSRHYGSPFTCCPNLHDSPPLPHWDPPSLILLPGESGHSISPITPSELLIALHYIDCQNDESMMKSVIKGAADSSLHAVLFSSLPVLPSLSSHFPIPLTSVLSPFPPISPSPSLPFHLPLPFSLLTLPFSPISLPFPSLLSFLIPSLSSQNSHEPLFPGKDSLYSGSIGCGLAADA